MNKKKPQEEEKQGKCPYMSKKHPKEEEVKQEGKCPFSGKQVEETK